MEQSLAPRHFLWAGPSAPALEPLPCKGDNGILYKFWSVCSLVVWFAREMHTKTLSPRLEERGSVNAFHRWLQSTILNFFVFFANFDLFVSIS